MLFWELVDRWVADLGCVLSLVEWICPSLCFWPWFKKRMNQILPVLHTGGQRVHAGNHCTDGETCPDSWFRMEDHSLDHIQNICVSVSGTWLLSHPELPLESALLDLDHSWLPMLTQVRPPAAGDRLWCPSGSPGSWTNTDGGRRLKNSQAHAPPTYRSHKQNTYFRLCCQFCINYKFMLKISHLP